MQECGAGMLNLRVDGAGKDRRIFVEAPKPKIGPVQASVIADVASALGATPSSDAPPLLVDVGPVWMVADLRDAATVHALEPGMAAVNELSESLDLTGITVFGRTGGGEADVYVRSFAPRAGVPEDPVCGSGNASVGAFLAESGLLDEIGSPYTAAQGHEIGRDGFVSVTVDPDSMSIEIGGASVTCIEGRISV